MGHFGSCVHDTYYMPGRDKNTGNAVKGLLETMGATISEISDASLPVLTYDVCERNALLSEGKDAYFALELFFGTEPGRRTGTQSRKPQSEAASLP